MKLQKIFTNPKFWPVILLMSMLACSLPNNAVKPASAGRLESAIVSDSHNRPAIVGRELSVVSVHTDSEGVQDVRFYVNDEPVSIENPPFSQTYFKVENRWTPLKAGAYTLKIEAHSVNPATDPTVFTMTVNAVDPSPQEIAAQVNPPVVSATPTLPSQVACLNDAAFVADVTVQDGSELQPGASFNKTWRIKNSGTCAWGAGYKLDLVNNAAFGASRIDVPDVAAGATVDLTLPMVAPVEGGTYRSNWRLFDSQGRAFGPTFYVDFHVLPTCQGPTIRRFTAQSPTIAPGAGTTLTWEVTGADSVKVTPAPQYGFSSAANSLTVSPDKTTTYTLEAKKGSCTSTAQVTVVVSGQSCHGMYINRFEASPAVINRGQTSTLIWEVTGATNVTIVPSPQFGARANTMLVSPEATTLYTLEARNAGCTLTRQTTVTVQNSDWPPAPGPAGVLYDFISGASGASWRAGAQTLPWSGGTADWPGYARWIDSVSLQNGAYVSRALQIRPAGELYVQGWYVVDVPGGLQPQDQIQLELAYLQGVTSSSGATYSVKFAPTDGPMINIGAVTVDPDGSTKSFVLPLNDVRPGQQGQFILEVVRGPYPNEGVSVWTKARLVRP